MDYETSKNEVVNFFKTNIKFQYFNKHLLEKLEKVFFKCLNDIEYLKKDVELVHSEEIIDDTVTALEIIQKVVYTIPITHDLERFCFAYTEMIYNWNANTLKRSDIVDKVNVIGRLLRQHLTINEAITQLKDLMNQVRQFKNWTPRSFDISKHYLSLLEGAETCIDNDNKCGCSSVEKSKG